MTTIKLLTCFVGHNSSGNAGDVFGVNDAEAKRLIDAGFAELVPPTPAKTETATAPTPTTETATTDAATPVTPPAAPAATTKGSTK